MVVAAGCGAGSEPARPPTAVTITPPSSQGGSADAPLALDCSPLPVSVLASEPPAVGGYRVLDDAELAEVHARIKTGMRFEDKAQLAREALSEAVYDQRRAIAACFRGADAIDRNTQYMFRLSMDGTTEGTLVTTVEIERVAGVDAQRQPVLVPTKAQACVAPLLQHLELPPSDWLSQVMFLVRADFCRVRRAPEGLRPT